MRRALSAARTCVDTYIGAYPDLIDMAGILASVRLQIFNTPAATPARGRAIDAVYTRLADRFPEYRDRPRPIEQWTQGESPRQCVLLTKCRAP
jgi:hypothetical protein